MAESKDWRLQGQETYLKDETLFYKQSAGRKTSTDHDHCEFCGSKFSETIADALKEGYATYDDYRWICSPCFHDFKVIFQFKFGHKGSEERST